MWEVIKEPRIFPSVKGPMPIEALGVRRDDGFTVIREVSDDWPYYEKSGDESFSAHGKLGKCKFVANRRKGGRETSTYRVSFVHADGGDAELTRAYAKDIKSAFIDGWPWEALHLQLRKNVQRYGITNPTFTPLEEVVFVGIVGTGPRQAEDLEEFMFTRGFEKDFDLSQRDKRWHLHTEHRVYKTSFELDEVSRMYEIIGIKREDGFTMTLEGITEDRTEIFQCKTNENEFRFSLKRWSRGSNGLERVMTKFQLSLYWFYPNWPGNKPDNNELCRNHYKDIESALLSFPLFRMFQSYVPVKEVVFNIGTELSSSEGTKLQ